MSKAIEIAAGVTSIGLFGYIILGMQHWFPIALKMAGM